jgi:hypothetical protein
MTRNPLTDDDARLPGGPLPGAPLDDALAALPRDVPPARDLWSGIEAQLEPAARDAPPATRRNPWGWQLAAAVMLVAASSLITAALLRRDDAPQVAEAPVAPLQPAAAQALPAAFGPSHRLSPEYELAHRQLSAMLQERIGRMPASARGKLEDNLAQLRRAADAINEALAGQPGDPLLEELLLSTYQEELAVLAAANQLTAAGGPDPQPDSNRMQL